MAVRTRTGLVLARMLQALPTIAGVIVVTFVMTRMLPGDPAVYLRRADGEHRNRSPRSVTSSVSTVALAEQFWVYLGDLATGDLGTSLVAGGPVTEEILRRLPASLELTLFGLAFAIGVALPLGVMAATRPNSWIDHLCRLIVTLGVSLPTFFTGLLLIYVFYYLAGVRAVAGRPARFHRLCRRPS